MSVPKNRTEIAFLAIIVIAGLVPLSIYAIEAAKPGTAWTLIDTFLRRPSGAVTFAVLFGFGALLASRIQQAFWAILLLPVLILALWPIFRGTAEELPVPDGAVVAFLQSADSEKTNACPSGWTQATALSGRFPLGAGLGPEFGGVQAPNSRLGVTGGEESVRLTVEQMPAHNHALATDEAGSLDIPTVMFRNTDNPDEGYGDRAALTAITGNDQPHNNMPPYRVVLFCEFTGQDNSEQAQEAVSGE